LILKLNYYNIKRYVIYNTLTLILSAFFIMESISILSTELKLVSQEYNIIRNAWARDINGTENADNITGTTNKDIIKGLGGNDTITGRGGEDNISGGSGDDTIYGNEGGDVLKGRTGNDHLEGGKGNDRIFGEIGDDTVTDFDKIQRDTIPKKDCENIDRIE
jgi:Ca2+-binding RTX toxin-like protein